MLRSLIKDVDGLLKRHKLLLLGVVPVVAGAAWACVTFGRKVVAPIDELETLRQRNAELSAANARLIAASESPSLQFNNVLGGLRGINQISLENKGNGAAYVQSYAWGWRGQRVLGEGAAAWDTLHQLLHLRAPFSVTGGYLERGDVLRANEIFRVLKLDSKSLGALKDYKRALSEVSLVVCYCRDRELKGECWKEILTPMGVAAPALDCGAPAPDRGAPAPDNGAPAPDPKVFTSTTTPSP